MKKWILCLTAIGICFSSCGRSNRDTALYLSSGRQKSIVAVLPVIDKTKCSSFNWELANEFTDEIRKRVYDSKRIYLLREAGDEQIAQQLNTIDPKAIPAQLSSRLAPAQFAVVTELLEHNETPYGPGSVKKEESGALLNLALRLRVVDLRQETPNVILQEIVEHEHNIARAYSSCNYEKMGWGTEAFHQTPLGIAHSYLFREIVMRVESYIEASR